MVSGRARVIVVVALIALVASASWLWIKDPALARVAILGGGALVLFLSEVVPPFAVTLALIAGIPLFLGSVHADYRLATALTWVADPVLALFFGGFALGVAATRHGIAEFVAERALAFSRHRRRRLLAVVIAATTREQDP